MLRRYLPTLAALAVLTLANGRAQTSRMPVSEVRTGMVGVGRTVFTGTRVEEFRAHILGVIENVIGPQRNLILARLEGGPLAETGVIAGMSGSPVYVDGRLIGAVSYALGSFSKEPIAGITPIDEMTAETNAAPALRPASARVHVEWPLTQDALISAFRRGLGWNRAFADRPEDARLIDGGRVAGVGGREVGTMLRPIATPLVMSGLEPSVADAIEPLLRDQGFVPAGARAGSRVDDMPFDGPLKPGDAVGVTFVDGDFLLGGTGTVTHIDGDRVYAFGHPMYNLGPTEFPMTRAYVYTVLPSLYSSTKLSSTGEIIGTLLQDRATAIAGRLGPGPSLIPVALTLASGRANSSRTFHFDVVKDQLLSPLMTYVALLNTLMSYERQMGTTTYGVKGQVLIKGHDPITFDNLFSGDQAPLGASAYIVAPLAAMMDNDYEKVDIQGVNLTMTSGEEPKTATLERVWLDDLRPRAGRTVPLKVLLKTYRGEDVLRTVPISIPANASGTLSILVSDGQRLTQAETREARPALPRSVPQLIRVLNKTRRNNAVYIKLLSADPGAVVKGELLSSLPPSVLSVLEADRSGGNFNPLYNATLGEWEIATDHAVNGVRSLSVSVSPN
jgi:SpoIVB peptidase S55